MATLQDLQPQAVWQNFYKLTQVPRPSNHEEKAREFMMNWAKENHIEARMDEAGNIIMSKPATPGMENRKGVILQGHLDMVPQKNEDTVHDFTKDPIQAYVDGEWVRFSSPAFSPIAPSIPVSSVAVIKTSIGP